MRDSRVAFPRKLDLTEAKPPPERFHEHFSLELTGAPTANFEILSESFNLLLSRTTIAQIQDGLTSHR